MVIYVKLLVSKKQRNEEIILKKKLVIGGALVGVVAVVSGLVVKTMRELNNKDMFADGLDDDDWDFNDDLDDDDFECHCGCCDDSKPESDDAE